MHNVWGSYSNLLGMNSYSACTGTFTVHTIKIMQRQKSQPVLHVHQVTTYHYLQLSSYQKILESWWRRHLLWRGQQLPLVQSWPLQLLLCSQLPQHHQLLAGSLHQMTDSELPPMDDAYSSGEGRDVKLSGEPSYAWQGETQCAPSRLDLV